MAMTATECGIYDMNKLCGPRSALLIECGYHQQPVVSEADSQLTDDYKEEREETY